MNGTNIFKHDGIYLRALLISININNLNTQMQSVSPAQPAAHHVDCDRVSQRGLDNVAAHGLERNQSIAATAAQGDHSGRRCERTRMARP